MCEDGRIVTERALEILRTAGFSVVQAADIARQTMQTTSMLVSGLAGATPAAEAAVRDAYIAAKRGALEALPVARFPRLVEACGALTDCDDEVAYYGFGVDLVIGGVEALARKAVC
jgi:TetR/AcrR family tetracycline transcriptional repressor